MRHIKEAILDDLVNDGYCITDNLVAPELAEALFNEGQSRWDEGVFEPARIGRQQQLAYNRAIRGDAIYWLEPDDKSPTIQTLFELCDDLQRTFNQQLFLGLKRIELHYARYDSGAGYARHRDQHQHTFHRKITFISYLNPNWRVGDGGELVIYDPDEPSQVLEEVQPLFGRTVIFRSELLEHEVLPSHATRWSVTGWFRDDELL